MKLSCSAKKKQPPPDPSPEAGLAGGLAGGLEAGVEAGLEAGLGAGLGASRRCLEAQGGKPSKTFQTSTPFKTLQTPSPTGTPGPRPLLNQATAMAFYWLSKLPFASPQTLQTLQNPPNAPKPSKRSKHHPKPPNPPGLEACFEQVAQGLWLVRRVHRRSKTILLPGRLELPTLRLTASRSNQLSYGSLCRRPKLVPVLEKRLNNSWLQIVCQTKGQQPK